MIGLAADAMSEREKSRWHLASTELTAHSLMQTFVELKTTGDTRPSDLEKQLGSEEHNAPLSRKTRGKSGGSQRPRLQPEARVLCDFA
jgi:hypothetical protein